MKLFSIFFNVTLVFILLNIFIIDAIQPSDGIGSKNYQKFLFLSTIRQNSTRKFIIDVLWKGISVISKNNFTENSMCLTSLNNYINGVLKTNDLWALKMYDASSGNQPGFLTGNIQDIGSYDECTEINYKPLAIVGKYCKVILNDTSSPLQDHIALKDIPVSYALCVPSSCTAQSIRNILNIGAKTINSSLLFTTDERTCFTETIRPFYFSDWIAILIFTVIVGLSVLATMYENFFQSVDNEKANEIILSFSIRKNFQDLLSAKKGEESISMLYGLRFLLMVWIILIHRFSQVNSVPAMGLFKWNMVLQDWSRAFITNGFICVDTFFVMGGLLLSYTFLNKLEKGENFSFVQLYIHRYIRLTPALAGLVLLYATVSDRLCEGPFTVSYEASIKRPCVKNWWAALLYINNYFDTDNMCAIQSWYNSIDMQLYLLSPMLLHLLTHRPKIMPYLIGALISLSVVISIVQPYMNHISAGYFIIGKFEDHRAFLENYIYTHTRVGSWLIGFSCGIYLFKYKQNPFPLQRKTLWVGWVLSVIIFSGVIFSILPFQQETHKYDPLYDTLYKSIHRHIWALASSWLIFTCATGYGGFLNKFLSWEFFLPMGRLTYCIHLTHILILKLQMAAQRTPINFTDMTRITTAFGDILGSVFSAAILYVLFEAPAIAVERAVRNSAIQSYQ